MLSKIDIQQSLGKSICFFPFKKDNIKENSINLTISKFSWTITTISQENTRSLNEELGTSKEWGQGSSCVIEKEKSSGSSTLFNINNPYGGIPCPR